jgi:hypothetical protein
MSGKEREDYFERYKNVDEYDAVLRWHCRLDEPKPVPEKKAEDFGSPMNAEQHG